MKRDVKRVAKRVAWMVASRGVMKAGEMVEWTVDLKVASRVVMWAGEKVVKTVA